MLQQFTWQQFLIAALILTLIWYAAVLLLFYRKRLTNLASSKRRNRKPVVQSSYDPRAEPDAEYREEALGLMGKPALPDGVSESATGSFFFADKEADPAADPHPNVDHRLGLVPDVVEELKTLFRIMETDGASKEDFISLFKLISSKYPGIHGSAEQQSLNAYIRQNLPFDISQKELDQLWQ